MRMLSEKPVVRTLITAFAVFTVSLLGITFLISSLNGVIQYPNIAISDAFASDPSRAIAAFLIPVATYFLVLVVVSRLIRLYPYVFRTRDMWLFSFIILCLVVTFFGLMGVAAVPINSQRSLHLVAAIMVFLGGGLMLIAFTLLDKSIDIDQPQFVLRYRIIVASLLVALGIALAITAEFTDVATAVLEIILVLLAVAYILSWTVESEFPIRSKSLPARVSILESERSDPPIY